MSDNVRFSAKQERFIDWLACGKNTRKPVNRAMLAEELGINERTLYRWQNGQNGFTSEEFWDEVTRRARELNRQALGNVYESLRREALAGSFQHTKLMLELTGEYTETQRREISGPDGSAIQIEKALDEALETIYGDNSD